MVTPAPFTAASEIESLYVPTAREADVTVTYVPCDRQGYVSPDDVRAAIKPNTRLVAVNHQSRHVFRSPISERRRPAQRLPLKSAAVALRSGAPLVT